jgi:hypothetical protein
MRLHLATLIARRSTVSTLFALLACGGGGTGDLSPAPPPAAPAPAPVAGPSPLPRVPTTFQPAQAALGQSGFEAGLANQGESAIGPRGLHFPVGLAITPEGDLLVADAGHHRLLRYGSIPATMAPEAQAAIGQPGLHSADAALTREGLNQPSAIAVGAGRMAVADAAAHRVLVYDRVPVRGEPAPVPVAVIGQPDFETGVQGCSRAGLAFPSSVVITPHGQLIVADAWNHRVLVWDALPLRQQDVALPSRVIGQRGPSRCVRNDDNEDGFEDFDPVTHLSRASARTLRFPSGVWSDGRRLVVADTANHRVLVWRHFPTTDFQPADVVLGHGDFAATDPNDNRFDPDAANFFGPQDVSSDGVSLAVADTVNDRVLVWATFPDRHAQAADVVLGHATFDRRLSNDLDGDGRSDGPTARTFDAPMKVLFAPGALLVSDALHHRVLVFGR